LAAGMLSSSYDATPTWMTSYSEAQRTGSAQQKPLVVMFGAGANGWTKANENPNSAEILKLLADQYVCVYVDTATPTGKKLAQDFAIQTEMGMVISSRDGATQAFWHQGDMPSRQMVTYLQRYADPNVMPRGTETANTPRTSFYPPSSQGDMNW